MTNAENLDSNFNDPKKQNVEVRVMSKTLSAKSSIGDSAENRYLEQGERATRINNLKRLGDKFEYIGYYNAEDNDGEEKSISYLAHKLKNYLLFKYTGYPLRKLKPGDTIKLGAGEARKYLNYDLATNSYKPPLDKLRKERSSWLIKNKNNLEYVGLCLNHGVHETFLAKKARNSVIFKYNGQDDNILNNGEKIQLGFNDAEHYLNVKINRDKETMINEAKNFLGDPENWELLGSYRSNKWEYSIFGQRLINVYEYKNKNTGDVIKLSKGEIEKYMGVKVKISRKAGQKSWNNAFAPDMTLNI